MMLDNLIAQSDVFFQKHVFPMVQQTPIMDQRLALAEAANMASNKTVDATLKLVLQIVNAVSFVVSMILTFGTFGLAYTDFNPYEKTIKEIAT